MSTPSKMNRRTFLKTSALAGAGLVLGFYIPLTDKRVSALGPTPTPTPGAELDQFKPNSYLKIDPDGTITVVCPRTEMGQGLRTLAAILIAEELDADYTKVHVENAGVESAFGDQSTGGSESTRTMHSPLRQAGARARTLLIAAAAEKWGVDAATCRTENSVVYGPESDQQLSYGELAPLAAGKQPSGLPQMKSADKFKIIGTRKPLIDTPILANGNAKYTPDIRLPQMLFAVVARCPVFGGSTASFDATDAKAVPGVRHVVQIDSGVAVVADNTWAAIRGRAALKITWNEGKGADRSTESIRKQLVDNVTAKLKNDKESDKAAKSIEAIYEQPYMAHATMEPMGCVADIRADSGEVWAPSQDRRGALSMASRGSGLPQSKITVHVPFIGCGWGRRLGNDYVFEAAQISKSVGVPISLFWTRTDDMQHDLYRPVTYHVLRGGLDAQGNPVSWRHMLASQGIGGGASEVASGARNLPYKISPSVDASSLQLGIPVGYWRAVFNTSTAFVNESFIDELATAAGKDPYQYRLGLMSSPRMETVLKLAAEKANWGSTLPAGRGRGIACYSTWDASFVAQVAEVSVDEKGTVTVHRVVCAVDCGRPLNLDAIEAQMEGGILAGMNAALKHEITIEKGQVKQTNFDDYPLVRMKEAPAVEVYVVPSDESPSGIGEMSNPVTPAAIANAIFAATGKRARRLPIRRSDLV